MKMDDGSWLGYVLVWFVLSVLIGMWAGRRGRSSGAWFFISLMFSPLLAAACILCFANLNTQICPACAEPVRKEAAICKHCHTNLRMTT
jgi:hypothetical protein